MILTYKQSQENKKNSIINNREKNTEKEWRDTELQTSDYIVPLTDHPKHAAYMTYRQELRDYPAQTDFPNGTRPVKP
jgi:hypothetical protein